LDTTHDYASWSHLPAAAKQSYIEQALAEYDGELEVLVSAYRYYFYKSRSERALTLADQVLERLQQDASLPRAWDELRPTLMAGKDDPIQLQIILKVFLDIGPHTDRVVARDLGDAVQEQDPVDQLFRVPHLAHRFFVVLLAKFQISPVLAHLRLAKVLVDRRQFDG